MLAHGTLGLLAVLCAAAVAAALDPRPEPLIRDPSLPRCYNIRNRMALEAFKDTQEFNHTLQKSFFMNDGLFQVAGKEMERYKVLKLLAVGSEGEVVVAVDTDIMELVAIKKVKSLFGGSQFMAKKVWAEMRFMNILNDYEDIMDMRRVLMPYNQKFFDTVYIVLEMLEIAVPNGGSEHAMDLYKDPEWLKQYAFQLTRGLHHMHSANLVHNDLRHFNTMLDKDCNLKIIDLGSAGPSLPVDKKRPLPLPVHQDVREFRRDIWMWGTNVLCAIGGKADYHIAARPNELQAYMIIRAFGYPSKKVLEMYDEDSRMAFEMARAKYVSEDMDGKEWDGKVMPLEDRHPDVDPALLKLVYRAMTLDRKVPTTRELLNDPYFKDMGEVRDGPKAGVVQYEYDLKDWFTPFDRVARAILFRDMSDLLEDKFIANDKTRKKKG